MKALWAALKFLTVFPVPHRLAGGLKELRRSVYFFSLVGLLIGILAAIVDRLLAQVLPELISAVLVVLVLLVASGGLHFDGLLDTADGLFSARPQERMLEIMRDSRTGSMGVVAGISVFALKVSCIASLPADHKWQVILLMPLCGRASLVGAMALGPYARSGGGLGTAFAAPPKTAVLIAALVVGAVASLLLGLLTGLLITAAATLATFCLSRYIRKKISGWTGDTLGATCEAVELVPPLVFCALAKGGGL
jgi:adenosylcobinamide-GDP ribazoletransferase